MSWAEQVLRACQGDGQNGHSLLSPSCSDDLTSHLPSGGGCQMWALTSVPAGRVEAQMARPTPDFLIPLIWRTCISCELPGEAGDDTLSGPALSSDSSNGFKHLQKQKAKCLTCVQTKGDKTVVMS